MLKNVLFQYYDISLYIALIVKETFHLSLACVVLLQNEITYSLQSSFSDVHRNDTEMYKHNMNVSLLQYLNVAGFQKLTSP
jgi:hypothetical protein